MVLTPYTLSQIGYALNCNRWHQIAGLNVKAYYQVVSRFMGLIYLYIYTICSLYFAVVLVI